tara:strand:+ start:136 stop:384 length:249 start_codon:yes stop_codon:yes gene_type:complete
MTGIKLTKGVLPKKEVDNGKLKMIKHIGVSFDKSKLNTDEEQVNKALASGYEIIHKFETGTGMVYVLGHYSIPSCLRSDKVG